MPKNVLEGKRGGAMSKNIICGERGGSHAEKCTSGGEDWVWKLV